MIFDLAVEENLLAKNPASLLFAPKAAKHGEAKVMSIEEVRVCFEAQDPELVIANGDDLKQGVVW